MTGRRCAMTTIETPIGSGACFSQASSAPNRPASRRVHRRRRHGVVVGRGRAGRHLQRPDRRDRREQQGVEVAGRDDPQPRRVEQRAIGAHAIAALVVVQLVVPAPHPRLAGNGGGEIAAGPDQAAQRRHRGRRPRRHARSRRRRRPGRSWPARTAGRPAAARPRPSRRCAPRRRRATRRPARPRSPRRNAAAWRGCRPARSRPRGSAPASAGPGAPIRPDRIRRRPSNHQWPSCRMRMRS